MEKVYLVRCEGNWDGEFNDICAYKSKVDAVNAFAKLWAEQKEMYLENYTDEDGVDSNLIIGEDSDTCKEIYLDGEYCMYHCTVSVQEYDVF